MGKTAKRLSISLLAFVGMAIALAAQTLTYYRDSVVYIETYLQDEDGTNRRSESGSGFILTASGYVLTAAHVVPQAKPNQQVKYWAKIRTVTRKESWRLQLIRSDPQSDAAILQFADAGLKLKPVKIGNLNAEVALDSTLYSLGFPVGSDQASMTGTLSALALEKGLWQTTLPLNHGNSGGPVFDKNFSVVGMAVSGMRVSGGKYAQGITYVVPLNLLYPVIIVVPGLASNFGLAEIPAAKVPTPTGASTHLERSYWKHNDSMMYLVAEGKKRAFYYSEPAPRLRPLGVKSSTLLFQGEKTGEEYRGTAFFFSRLCGTIAYKISGPIENNSTRVVMNGQKPQLDASCRRRGYADDTLVFNFQFKK